MPEAPFGVLCMAYGSPRDDAGVEAYYTDIRGGRRPSDEALEDLRRRYRAIGGSPLEGITRRQAAALARELDVPVFVGMKHAAPFIEEAASEASAAGIERLVGLPLAPHYARMSFDGYERALRASWTGELATVRGFHDSPAFVAAIRSVLSEALRGGDPDRLFFTAHSLPERIVGEGDRYDERLLESCRLVAAGLDLPPWEFAFQSQSKTGEPWLGPDLLEAVEASSARRVLVCPIGFVADHLEILFDLDVEAQDFARSHGLEIRRTPSLNDRPEFIAALAAAVRERIEAVPARA